jgi:hypothetical protein
MTESSLTPLGHDRNGLRSTPADRWGGFDDAGAAAMVDAAGSTQAQDTMGTVTVTVQLGFRVTAEREREILPALMRAAIQLVDSSEVELLHANTARNETQPTGKRSSNGR